MRVSFLLLLALGACAGCPAPAPGPIPLIFDGGAPLDAGADDGCRRACAAMRSLACGDVDAACEDVCRHVVATHLTPIDPPCAAKAGSKEELRACVGPWRCP